MSSGTQVKEEILCVGKQQLMFSVDSCIITNFEGKVNYHIHKKYVTRVFHGSYAVKDIVFVLTKQ